MSGNRVASPSTEKEGSSSSGVTGSVEGVWALAERNDLSVTDCLTHGQRIKWDETDVVDPSVVERYAAEGICPATDQ